ncbi:hypothetical protein [Spirosoma flavum]|uniref:Signal transduction histidine kinase dimerisation/phosphoacceptor domain-containing protein n=1 Tax=Spirosoma flavum TaxID=2048557 RepID=A0ABW6AVI8_9BACT
MLEQYLGMEQQPRQTDQIVDVGREQDDKFRTLAHDLMNCFSAINFAAHFLESTALSTTEKTVYRDVLTRNLTSAESLLTLLQSFSHQSDVTSLLPRLHAQLPAVVPEEGRNQIEQFKQIIDGLLPPIIS